MTQVKLTAKQQFWRGHLDAQRRTGVSRKAYCATHGLNPTHMDHYAAYLRKKLAESEGRSTDFIKFTPETPQRVTVRLSSGVAIDCPVDRALLREVLKSAIEIH